MISYLYFTDPHAKGKSPSTRTDDFPETILRKIAKGFEIGHENNVDFFMCGGDFVDSAYVSPKFVRRLGRVIKENLKGKKLFFVWGNHDIIAWNPKTAEDTAFGLFEEFFDDMIPLTREPTRYTFNGEDILLSGVHSYANLDRHILDAEGNILEHRSRDYVITEDYDAPVIHTVHGYLSPKAILEDIPHTVIAEMSHTKATITQTGHEHTGFAPITLPNGIVVNPGALGRVFASHTEMNRMPQYTLNKVHGIGNAEVIPIQCPIAEKGDVVMDRTALDEKKARQEILLQAKANMNEVLSEINIQAVELHIVMQRFKDKVDDDVYAEAKRRLGV
jgi:DNA repair exonuclease SbcCD nuclease subunit